MKTAQIAASYVDHMGTDLTVVNAARASFDKTSTFEVFDGRPVLRQADANLIEFLARGYTSNQWDELAKQLLGMHDPAEVKQLLMEVKTSAQHWAPFAHPHIQLRVTAPIFLARQFVKHQVGGVWSEESRRYIDDEPEFWVPDVWHARPESVKQGSGEALGNQGGARSAVMTATENSLAFYKHLLEMGAAPEEARIVLPLNMMTTWVWTGSLLFFSRVANQRVDSHAQHAAQELGRKIAEIIRPLYPVSWQALVPRV